MSQEVMQRWQAFVQKVTSREQEILNEANQGFEQLLADPNLDPYVFTNAFSAIEVRCKDLMTTLSQTYSQQVALQLGAIGSNADQLLHEATWWLFEQLERFRASQKGRLVRTLWPRVEASMNRPVNCQKCGGPLPRKVFHQAESVTCPNCGVLNSVSPESIVYTYFSIAPDLYAEEQTIDGKLALEKAEQRGASREERLHLAEPFWRAYVQARSTISPMAPQEQAEFLQSRLSMTR